MGRSGENGEDGGARKKAKVGDGFDIEALAEKADKLSAARDASMAAFLSSKSAAANLAPVGTPLEQELMTFLTQVKRGLMSSLSMEERLFLDKGSASLELEARLGMVVVCDGIARGNPTLAGSGAVSLDQQEMRMLNYEFQSGVSAPTFAAVKLGAANLYPPSPDGRIRCPEEVTVDHVYAFPEGRRAVLGRGGKDPVRWERKVSKMDLCFQLPAAPYDMRIAASIEIQEGGGGDGEEERDYLSGYEIFRKKQRSSWKMPSDYPPELALHWRLDTTSVTSPSNIAGGVASGSGAEDVPAEVFEVELELDSNTMKQWLYATDEEVIQQMTSLLVQRLVQLVEKLNPSQPLSSIAHPQREPRPTVTAAVLRTMEEFFAFKTGASAGGKGGAGKPRFPGAMPVNICRKNFTELQQGDYLISEKTDGVRYLLACVRDESDTPACCLLDRSMNCFRVAGDAALAGALGVGTVLDGELVHNLSKGKALFMVFDILRMGDEILVDLNFRDRFTKLVKNVLPSCEAGTEPGRLLGDSLPIMRKRFFRRTDIMTLFGFITSAGQQDRVYYDGEWRHHKTDGVIFQPNTPYHMGRDDTLMKWKWIDLASIDLKVTRTGTGLRLATQGESGGDIDMTSVVRLTEHDCMRLRTDMKATGGYIAEVALDPPTGLWVYMQLRPDKDRPNFITTVMSTLMELAEGITEQELQFRMMAADPSQDDWSRHFQKMQKQAVKWQQDRTKQQQM